VAEEKWPQRGGGRERVGSQAGAGRGRAQLRVARQLTVVLAEPRRAACATNGTVDQKALRARRAVSLNALSAFNL
jgi:hypothetical protein